MKDLVTITIFKIVSHRSSKYETIEKVQEISLPEGNHKLHLDNRNIGENRYVSFINYNGNNTQVYFKCDDGHYDPLDDIFHKYPEGIKIVPEKVFKSIHISRKSVQEHFSVGSTENCRFKIIYAAILFFILYKVFTNNSKPVFSFDM